MFEDPIAEELERVLNFNGPPPVVWNLPENATVRPGDGPNPWHGLTITHWSAD